MRTEIPANIKRFFWDVDPNALNLEKDGKYMIARILEYGDLEAIHWLFAKFDKSKIRDVFTTSRGFSPRTIYFWKAFFNLQENQILCLRRSYPETQKELWPY